MEEKLKFFKEYFNDAQFGFALIRTSDFFIMINPALKNLLGYTEEEINKVDLKDITSSEDMGITNEYANKIVHGEIKHYSFTKRYIKKDQSILWADVSVSAIGNYMKKTPKYILVTIKDKSEYKNIENEFIDLIESEIKNNNRENQFINLLRKDEENSADDSRNTKSAKYDSNYARNKRRYFRCNLDTPFCAEMKIVNLQGMPITSNRTKVCVAEIGPGGLKFISDLQFYIESNFQFIFNMMIFSEELFLTGNLVRKSEREDGFIEYGVEFVVNEGDRSNLIRIFNNVNMFIRNKFAFNYCRRCTKGSIYNCYKERELEVGIENKEK